MRALSPSVQGLSVPAKITYGAVIGVCMVIILYGLREGPLFVSAATLLLLIPFILAAPFVLGGRWRAPAPQPTRRPVVRRRR